MRRSVRGGEGAATERLTPIRTWGLAAAMCDRYDLVGLRADADALPDLDVLLDAMVREWGGIVEHLSC